jgi:hypothetical protein
MAPSIADITGHRRQVHASRKQKDDGGCDNTPFLVPGFRCVANTRLQLHYKLSCQGVLGEA